MNLSSVTTGGKFVALHITSGTHLEIGVADRQRSFPWKRNVEYSHIERSSREGASRFALTTETRYRCVVIYNDYRLDPDLERWLLSPDEGETRVVARRGRCRVPMALDYVVWAASNRVSRFVWNLIPLRRVVKSRYIARRKPDGWGRATPSYSSTSTSILVRRRHQSNVRHFFHLSVILDWPRL